MKKQTRFLDSLKVDLNSKPKNKNDEDIDKSTRITNEFNSSHPVTPLLGDFEREILKYALRNTEDYQNFYNRISIELIKYFIQSYPKIKISCYGRTKSITSFINKQKDYSRTSDNSLSPVEDEEAMTLIFDTQSYLGNVSIEKQREFIYHLCSSFFEDPANSEKYSFVLHDNETIKKENGYNAKHITIFSPDLPYSFLEIHVQTKQDYITAEYGSAAHHKRESKDRKSILTPLLYANPKSRSYKNTIRKLLRSVPEYKVNEYSDEMDAGHNRFLTSIENCYKYFHSILELPEISEEEFNTLSETEKQTYLEDIKYQKALFNLIDALAEKDKRKIVAEQNEEERDSK